MFRILNDLGKKRRPTWAVGRYYWDKKDTAEDCRSVSILFLKRHGYLSGFSIRSGGIVWRNSFGEETSSTGITVSTIDDGEFVRFYYTVTDRSTGQKTDYDYRISLTTTPCHFGGVRFWFICPLSVNGVYCGRRVAKLYLPPGAYYYGCRHCYNLSYESRNETRSGIVRAFGRVLKTQRHIEELSNQINWWTYRGKPTRKVRRLQALERQLQQGVSVSKMLLNSERQRGQFLQSGL